MTRVLALAAVAALLAGTSLAGTVAAADETVATAAAADAHPPGVTAPAPAPLNLAADRPGAGGDVLMTACGPERVNDQGVVENKPHGEISVGGGTRGYREVGGTICQPLPGGGFVAITAGSSHFGR
jgi:hypothetical protein